MTDAKPDLTVTNVVSLTFTDCKLPMLLLVDALGGRYDRNVFPPVVSTCYETKTASSVFSTGKLVLCGAKSKYHGLYAAHLLVRRIRHTLGLPLNLLNFSMKNIVGATNLGHEIDLDAFYRDHQDTTDHCPEKFPGLRWCVYDEENPNKPKFSYTVYSKGPAICAGIQNISMLKEAESNLTVFHKYRLTEESKQSSAWKLRKGKAKKGKTVLKLREASKNRKDAETEAARIAQLLSQHGK